MQSIQVLDCTLRDGGYVNNWLFGTQSIHTIVSKLQQSEIDIIECGYLDDTQETCAGRTIFSSVEEITPYIGAKKSDILYVAMIDYGSYSIENLSPQLPQFIDGIRLCFHKKDWRQALEYGRQIMEKGYLVFLQPMVSITYTDSELLELFACTNEIGPYAIYFVDSFGIMSRNDLLRLFYLYDHNIHPAIRIGYHAHNNMQLAFANAQVLLDIHTSRNLIIDVSVFGMGRGAGNLNAELFLDYLNCNFGAAYDVHPLLELIDQELNRIYAEHFWGYSLPHYLSSVNNCHPNYATFLSEKNTLTITSIGDILANIPEAKKSGFSKKYIEELYTDYQSKEIGDSNAKAVLERALQGRQVLLLAPGATLVTHASQINAYIEQNNPVVIGVNMLPQKYNPQYVFLSNRKRLGLTLEMLRKHVSGAKLLITSNVSLEKHQLPEDTLAFNYNSLLVPDKILPDNSAPMLLRLLGNIGVQQAAIAGMDGYQLTGSNYYDKQLEYTNPAETNCEKNDSIKTQIHRLKKHMEIHFITPSIYCT